MSLQRQENSIIAAPRAALKSIRNPCNPCLNPSAVLADPLWPKLSTDARRIVCAWEEIARRIALAPDKNFEISRICRDFAGVVQGLSRGTIYRKIAAYRAEGIAGVLPRKHLKLIGCAPTSLPALFLRYWHRKCGDNQRGKILTVWQDVMTDLISGKVIPGYDTDWRGIWLREHPGYALPKDCPYKADHRRNAHPFGWSYRNLKNLAPGKDVLAAAHQGVAAGRAYLPSIPHTRVGLGLMQVITMDDVWHDVEVLFLDGPQLPKPERPVEVGALDILTGCHIAWQVWPVLRRDDGTRQMVDWTVQRFIQAQIFCGIGIHPGGITELLEHGTAVQVARKFEFRINNPDAAFLALENDGDVRALGAEFNRIRTPGTSQVSKTLSKGLTYLLDQDEIDDDPLAEERTAQRLKAILLRSEIIRATRALSAAATTATATWIGDNATDPDTDLLAAVIAAGDGAGLNPNRILFGSTAWQKRILRLRGMNTAGGFAGANMTPEDLAKFLAIDKIVLSNERYTVASSGKGATKQQLVSSDLALFYNAREGVGKDDPSNIKRFWTPMQNGAGEWAVYRRDVGTGSLVEITVAHRSQIVITADAGIRKLTIS